MSKWNLLFTPIAEKNFEKLDRPIQQRIRKFLKARLASDVDPRTWGKPLTGDLSELWSYRVGNYRIISKIEDEEFLILIMRVAHRKEVYE